MSHYIWQLETWPDFFWSAQELEAALGKARFQQGRLLGQVHALGFNATHEVRQRFLVTEAVQTSAIEGVQLDPDAVRSSVARRLGLPTAGLSPATPQTENLVDLIFDATNRYDRPLTADRLKRWQAALFPTGYSGLNKIIVGDWRKTALQVISGPIGSVHPEMRIFVRDQGMRNKLPQAYKRYSEDNFLSITQRSGEKTISGWALGKEREHFEAPPPEGLEKEMDRFFTWFGESSAKIDGLLRAGLAHLYFVTIHPFEDGNGRIARAITDMALAQDEKLANRFYSLSGQIMNERDEYYAILENTQKGNGDVTAWLSWFLSCFQRALERSENLLENVVLKGRFWQRIGNIPLSQNQHKVVNTLLDAGPGGFKGGLTTRKFAGIAHVSRATAYREISDLISKGILKQNQGRGRNVSYDLNLDET